MAGPRAQSPRGSRSVRVGARGQLGGPARRSLARNHSRKLASESLAHRAYALRELAQLSLDGRRPLRAFERHALHAPGGEETTLAVRLIREQDHVGMACVSANLCEQFHDRVARTFDDLKEDVPGRDERARDVAFGVALAGSPTISSISVRVITRTCRLRYFNRRSVVIRR